MNDKPCSVPECEKAARKVGLCPMHYRRLRVHGTTDDPPSRKVPLATRLWRNAIITPSGCWEFTGSKSPNGYGALGGRGLTGSRLAHRVAYELWVGPVPEGMQLDHLCRNRPCFNPEHLEPVTPQVNQRRGDGPAGRNARKTHCVNGHPFDEKNTRYSPEGHRRCRACHRESEARRAAKRRADRDRPVAHDPGTDATCEGLALDLPVLCHVPTLDVTGVGA